MRGIWPQLKLSSNLQPGKEEQWRDVGVMSTDGIYETYDDQVFIFTGDVRAVIPRDVVRVRVDPSVTSIPGYVFILFLLKWQIYCGCLVPKQES